MPESQLPGTLETAMTRNPPRHENSFASPSDAIGSAPGTYALLLDLPHARTVRVGRLGTIVFEAGFYLYAGSAFGPGGLAARLDHHLHIAARPHWHLDHLRREARVAALWITRDPRHLECAFFEAALRMRGARPVPRFGSSDCRCPSHLVALPRLPRRDAFRRHLGHVVEDCGRIFEIHQQPECSRGITNPRDGR